MSVIFVYCYFISFLYFACTEAENQHTTKDGNTEGLLRSMQGFLPFLQASIGFKPVLEIRSFENWSQTVFIPYVFYVAPKTLQHVQRIVQVAGNLGFGIRVAGAGHSMSPLFADIGQILIDTKQLLRHDGPRMELNKDAQNGGYTLTVISGATMKDVNAFLTQNNLELRSQPVIAEVTVGGVISTASHSAFYEEPEMSSYLVAARIIDGRGELWRFNNDDHPQTMRTLRNALGMCGILYDLTLKVYPTTVISLSRLEVKVRDIIDPEKLRHIVTSNSFSALKWPPFNSLTDREVEEYTKTGKVPVSWNPLDDAVFIDVINNDTSSRTPQPSTLKPPEPPSTHPPTREEKIRFPSNIMKGLRSLPGQITHNLTDALIELIPGAPDQNTELRLYDTNDFTASAQAILNTISEVRREATTEGNIPIFFVNMRWMKNSDCFLCPASIQNEDIIGPNSSGHTVGIGHITANFTAEYKRLMSKIALASYPNHVRVHLGKVHTHLPRIIEHLHRVYGDSFRRFKQVCNQLDPKLTFANTWLKRLLNLRSTLEKDFKNIHKN